MPCSNLSGDEYHCILPSCLTNEPPISPVLALNQVCIWGKPGQLTTRLLYLWLRSLCPAGVSTPGRHRLVSCLGHYSIPRPCNSTTQSCWLRVQPASSSAPSPCLFLFFHSSCSLPCTPSLTYLWTVLRLPVPAAGQRGTLSSQDGVAQLVLGTHRKAAQGPRARGLRTAWGLVKAWGGGGQKTLAKFLAGTVPVGSETPGVSEQPPTRGPLGHHQSL